MTAKRFQIMQFLSIHFFIICAILTEKMNTDLMFTVMDQYLTQGEQ